MGRPIKKIFIGERGAGNAGGEGVASVTLGGTNNSTGYTDLDALTISAPDLVGGVQAVGHVLETAGVIDSVVITLEGSGYTSAPTVTADTGTQGTLTLTAVLTTTGAAVIASTAYVATTNESADMIAQRATRTYRVETATDGIGECTLVAATPTAAGEMAIAALDFEGNSYWVTKLMNRTVILTQNNLVGTFEHADGAKVKWGDVAIVNDTVKITS